MNPTRLRGLRDAYGSWKIIVTCAPERAQALTREAGDVLPVEPDGSARRREQVRDHPGERRLAASRLADDPERLATAHL